MILTVVAMTLAVQTTQEPPSLPTFKGKVVSVLSGDTVILERVGFAKNVKAFIWGIDAPDEGQPFFNESKTALERMVNRELTVVPIIVSQDGTLKVDLYYDVDVEEVHLNELLCYGGFAWWSPLEDKSNTMMFVKFKDAQKQKRGLFKSGSAVAPWTYRYRKLVESRKG